MSERKNPYQRLKDEVEVWAIKVLNPTRRTMWTYPKNRLSEGWPLYALAERVAAADQLDRDVRLRYTNDGLVVEYVERPPHVPYSLDV